MSHAPDADRLVAEAQRIAEHVIESYKNWRYAGCAKGYHLPILSALQQAQARLQGELDAANQHVKILQQQREQAQAPDPSIALIHRQLDAAGIPRCENVSLRVEEALARLEKAREQGAPRERGEWAPTAEKVARLFERWSVTSHIAMDDELLNALSDLCEALPAPPAPSAEK